MRKLLFLVVTLFVSSLAYAAEQCPNGGALNSTSGRCCKDHKAWNTEDKDYNYVQPRLCGCPDGGKPGSSNTYDCCKNNYAYNDKTNKYDYLNPGECGCPNGGEVKYGVGVNGGNVCCKNGYAHEYYFGTDPVVYNEIDPSKCGCPDGMTPDKQNGAYCCKNGRVFFGQTEYSVQPDRCGCPDEGQVWKDRFCQKNGYMWNDMTKKYDLPNAALGCPQGSQEKNGVCCKNGYAFNEITSKFDAIDGLCGCPQGSKTSEWGVKYANLMKETVSTTHVPNSEEEELKKHTERMVLQFNAFCCKNGKTYNKKTGKFDIDIPLCKPLPNNPKDLIGMLWDLCSNGVLMCM